MHSIDSNTPQATHLTLALLAGLCTGLQAVGGRGEQGKAPIARAPNVIK